MRLVWEVQCFCTILASALSFLLFWPHTPPSLTHSSLPSLFHLCLVSFIASMFLFSLITSFSRRLIFFTHTQVYPAFYPLLMHNFSSHLRTVLSLTLFVPTNLISSLFRIFLLASTYGAVFSIFSRTIPRVFTIPTRPSVRLLPPTIATPSQQGVLNMFAGARVQRREKASRISLLNTSATILNA